MVYWSENIFKAREFVAAHWKLAEKVEVFCLFVHVEPTLKYGVIIEAVLFQQNNSLIAFYLLLKLLFVYQLIIINTMQFQCKWCSLSHYFFIDIQIGLGINDSIFLNQRFGLPILCNLLMNSDKRKISLRKISIRLDFYFLSAKRASYHLVFPKLGNALIAESMATLL